MSISESKANKRGRPRVLTPEQEATAAHISRSKSARGRQNAWFAHVAMTRMMNVPGMGWLFDLEKMHAGGAKSWKPSLLAELGRFEEPDAMIAAAAQICAAKPSIAEGVRLVRQWRTGKRPKHSREKLQAALCDCLNGYMALHPDCPVDDVADALWSLWGQALRMMDPEPEEGE